MRRRAARRCRGYGRFPYSTEPWPSPVPAAGRIDAYLADRVANRSAFAQVRAISVGFPPVLPGPLGDADEIEGLLWLRLTGL